MSGRHAPHIQRRNGIFHLRVRVPDALKVRVGLVEVRRSLQTYSTERARLLAAIYVPRLRKIFQMVDTENITRERAQGLILSCFDDLRCVVESGYLPSSGEPELELAEQAALAAECIRQSENSIGSRKFPAALVRQTSDVCASQGVVFANLPEGSRHDLMEGIARAVIEQQRLYILRLSDRLSPFVPADPLFFGAINCTAAQPGTLKTQGQTLGPDVNEAVSAYLDHGRKKWTAKTHAGRTRQLRYFQEHFGSKTPLLDISTADARGALINTNG